MCRDMKHLQLVQHPAAKAPLRSLLESSLVGWICMVSDQYVYTAYNAHRLSCVCSSMGGAGRLGVHHADLTVDAGGQQLNWPVCTIN